MAQDYNSILDKYKDIIKEEVNVKDVEAMPADVEVVKVIKPLGSEISSKFGKETGEVIKNSKQGNVEEKGDGTIKVFGDDKEWELEIGDYEIEYQGIDETNMSVEGGTVVRLDLNIDETLKKEGVAREISRTLNQMRKDADYDVDARVNLYYFTQDDYINSVMEDFKEFLSNEALLENINYSKTPSGDIVENFEYEGETIKLSLSK